MTPQISIRVFILTWICRPLAVSMQFGWSRSGLSGSASGCVLPGLVSACESAPKPGSIYYLLHVLITANHCHGHSKSLIASYQTDILLTKPSHMAKQGTHNCFSAQPEAMARFGLYDTATAE